ncbi:MAG TPA: ABC transporter ATP-binding protein [Ktedonobacterales bacterium]|nr:ABC transporter ATP-binding protein [Ktedonobacterales bacterium]
MFEAEDVHSYYGGAHVLQGVSLRVPEGTVVALLGRNGVGKTSFIRSAIGMTPPAVRGGSIRYRDQELLGKSSYRIAGLGIGLVPQGRRIFRSLTVVENLTMAAHEDKSGQLAAGKSWDLDRVWEVFPRLAERKKNRGNELSGGEQQMLAIARALMTNPTLLLMDEPSEGLAPVIVQQLRDQMLVLKNDGLSILLVEQQLGLALAVADDVYILDKGTVVYHGTPGELHSKPDVMHRYLGV